MNCKLNEREDIIYIWNMCYYFNYYLSNFKLILLY